MQMPYTSSPVEAVVAAQSCVATVLTAVIWARPLPTKAASYVLVLAIWLAALLPVEPDVARMVLRADLEPTHAMHALKISAALATLAMALTWRPILFVAAVCGEVGLSKICNVIEKADFELAAFHLVWFGALIAMADAFNQRVVLASPKPTARSHLREDSLLFVLSTLLAATVAIVVLERSIDSDDEWAYTYQADLFAHAKAYAIPPPCGNAFRMFWIWFYTGRSFAQYTPGWPLFMAPFALLGVPWLAASFAHGLLTVGVARLARRVASANAGTTREILFAGRIAAIAAATGIATLLNGGSRYSHTFVAACFAWSVEAVCMIAVRGRSSRSEWGWGIVVGLAISFCGASRPGDGATLGLGIGLFFLYSLLRGRIGWRAFLGTTIAFCATAALCLVILRLQLGVWFKTGYSVVEQFQAWAVPKYSLPAPSEVKFGIPLATSAYSFWPCSAAFVSAGLFGVRKEGRAVVFMLVTGSLVLAVFLSYLEFGRGFDFGYGPRFHMPHVVTMAVATGVLLGPLVANGLTRVGSRRFASAGPATLILAAMAVGVFRIALLMFPYAHDQIRLRNAVFRAIDTSKIHHAIVTVDNGAVFAGSLDLPQNLPSQPDADVLIATPNTPEEAACLRQRFAGRSFYAATGRGTTVSLVKN